MKKFHLAKAVVLSAVLLTSMPISFAANEENPAISSAVTEILKSNNAYAKVGAEIDGKEVVLVGTVNNINDATSLICRIANLNGVEDIGSSKLKSLSDDFSPAKDAAITSKITANMGGGALNTRVTTNAGVVLLVGSVSSTQKLKHIEALVSKTEGVKCVASHLTVKQ